MSSADLGSAAARVLAQRAGLSKPLRLRGTCELCMAAECGDVPHHRFDGVAACASNREAHLELVQLVFAGGGAGRSTAGRVRHCARHSLRAREGSEGSPLPRVVLRHKFSFDGRQVFLCFTLQLARHAQQMRTADVPNGQPAGASVRSGLECWNDGDAGWELTAPRSCKAGRKSSSIFASVGDETGTVRDHAGADGGAG